MQQQHLPKDFTLQDGKYKIERKLGQGGFGITYLAFQTGLDRRVAIKEFFMKDFCERDAQTQRVVLGTTGSRETVSLYQKKFLKEAQHIARLSHPHIVDIIDVFSENDTSYYVMKYVPNGSLAEKVKAHGALDEATATRYILQVAEALDFVHRQKMNHLDVKPANIMLDDKDNAVLIDFGLSKQYDAETGRETSTTPPGIAEGFAPMEQYKKGGVGAFTPETDIYSLGATFFFLLTGTPPPSAPEVNENGVPLDILRTKGVSKKAVDIIAQAMEGRRKDRMKSVRIFMEELKGAGKDQPVPNPEPLAAGSGTSGKAKEPVSGETRLKDDEKKPNDNENNGEAGGNKPIRNWMRWLPGIVGVLVVIGIVVGIISSRGCSSESADVDTVTIDSVVEVTIDSVAESVDADSAAIDVDDYVDDWNKVIEVGDVQFVMVRVNGGTFTMGATSEMTDPFDEEKPTHQVTLSSYYIGETEVTQALWKAVMGSNPSYFKGDDLPVEQVSWHDCQTFISKLNGLTGQHFRLPTEAEWEFAARGGNQSRHTQYSGSSRIDDVAWYDGNSGDRTHPVKTKQPNELGIYDMTGNVWEWCQDWYGDYNSYAQTNPTGASSGFGRVGRGGSWCSYPRICRSSGRYNYAPGSERSDLGLRLVLSE